MSEHHPNMSAERKNLLDQKVAETVNEGMAQGMNPILCVVVLQTYEGLSVRGAADSSVVRDDEKWQTVLEKIKTLIEEYCHGLPALEVVPGSGPS
jgi:hypothetical protein